MNKIKLYTRDTCFYCNEAKKLLRSAGKEFEEIQIGRDIERGDVLMAFPHHRVLPIVLVNEEVIGSYAELLDYIYPAKGEYVND